jgi:hypothetical protein
VRFRLSDRDSRRVGPGLLIGFGIFVLGFVWLVNVLNAESRSRAVQRGVHATAAVEARALRSSCFHFTCNQTEYTVRYLAEGRVYRARVLVDGWEHPQAVGSIINVVYESGHPGRVEVAGRPPSAVAPELGAIIALVVGTLLMLAWGRVALKRRTAI